MDHKVLIVDDDQNFRSLLSRALQSEGIACDIAEDGVSGEALARRKRYDVIISDLRMPRKHGYDLLLNLVEDDDHPMLIAITGLEEPRIAANLVSKGIAQVICKPLSARVFAATLKVQLNKRDEEERSKNVTQQVEVADQIAATTTALKDQLAAITSSFNETITQLEKKRDDLEAGYLGSVRMLTNILSQLETAGGSHVSRVEALASAIGRQLGLDRDDQRDLQIAALLHDIGLFGMPDKVRSAAPWALSGPELKAYHKYPIISAALLSEVPGTEKVVAIIHQHAENFDGSGFPAGRRSQQIPLTARILRIADGCDTFIMHNADDLTSERLREHLIAEKGKAYDPELIGRAFKQVLKIREELANDTSRLFKCVELRAGLVLAEDIYDEDGHFLARSGATVTEAMLPHLKRLLRDRSVRVHVPAEETPAENAAADAR